MSTDWEKVLAARKAEVSAHKASVRAATGGTLRRLIKEAGHTRVSFSAAVGIPLATLNRILAGKSSLKLEDIFEMSKVLDMWHGDLLHAIQQDMWS